LRRNTILRYIYKKLIKPILTAHNDPQPVALGVFIGIFVGTTPSIGIQIPLAIIVAAIFRANKIVAAAMTWPANWFTAVPLYWFEQYVGAKILDLPPLHLDDIQRLVNEIDWKNFWELAGRNLFWPLIIGGVVVALVFAIPWYFLTLWVLSRRHGHIVRKVRAGLAERKLVLASKSPRRRKLVSEWGYEFEAAEPNVDEPPLEKFSPAKVARHHARHKARAAARNYPDAIVVSADTITVLKKKVIGKPADEADAERILRELSGTKHSIITAVCAIDTRTGRRIVEEDEAFVRMRPLTDGEIREYVKSGEAMGKAGAYAVQETGDKFIISIDGNLETVIGLPRSVFENVIYRLLMKPSRRNRATVAAAHNASPQI
jgi:septum formation protein